MAKKAKQNVDKIVKKVNKEFEKTSAQIEGLVNDALKQFDSLQNQVQEPVRKLLKEIDELRDREMKRFHEEFERRLDEFHELQSSILERLGVASKEAGKEVKKLTDEVSKEAAPPLKKQPRRKPPNQPPKQKPLPANLLPKSRLPRNLPPGSACGQSGQAGGQERPDTGQRHWSCHCQEDEGRWNHFHRPDRQSFCSRPGKAQGFLQRQGIQPIYS